MICAGMAGTGRARIPPGSPDRAVSDLAFKPGLGVMGLLFIIISKNLIFCLLFYKYRETIQLQVEFSSIKIYYLHIGSFSI